jgi:AraC-like DNA-binding protein
MSNLFRWLSSVALEDELFVTVTTDRSQIAAFSILTLDDDEIVHGEVGRISVGRGRQLAKRELSILTVLGGVIRNELPLISYTLSMERGDVHSEVWKEKFNVLDRTHCVRLRFRIARSDDFGTEALEIGLKDRSGSSRTNGTRQRLMSEAEQYLAECLESTSVPQVNEFAHRLGVPAYSASRDFKRVTRMHLGAFFRTQQVMHARRLLELEPDLDLASVARRSAFGSYQTFVRVFRRELQKNPSRYREEIALATSSLCVAVPHLIDSCAERNPAEP